jgi:uncharacterized membrane protein
MAEQVTSGLSDNAAGAIAYITPIPAIIFLVLEPFNKNRFIRFHAWQSILLCVASIVVNVALGILLSLLWVIAPFMHLFIWPLIQLFWFIIWLVCIFKAWSKQEFKLPIIGAIAEQQANK